MKGGRELAPRQVTPCPPPRPTAARRVPSCSALRNGDAACLHAPRVLGFKICTLNHEPLTWGRAGARRPRPARNALRSHVKEPKLSRGVVQRARALGAFAPGLSQPPALRLGRGWYLVGRLLEGSIRFDQSIIIHCVDLT